MNRPLCVICGAEEALAAGRCRADYRFWRKHGRDRTRRELDKLARRRQAIADRRYERQAFAVELREVVAEARRAS